MQSLSIFCVRPMCIAYSPLSMLRDQSFIPWIWCRYGRKLFAAAVFLLLAICLLYLLVKYIFVLWRQVRNLQPWAVALLLWFASLLASQLSDKSDLNHTHFGRAIEENAECWAAIFMFLAVIQIIPTLNARETPQE